jgi:hypothetical protein
MISDPLQRQTRLRQALVQCFQLLSPDEKQRLRDDIVNMTQSAVDIPTQYIPSIIKGQRQDVSKLTLDHLRELERKFRPFTIQDLPTDNYHNSISYLTPSQIGRLEIVSPSMRRRVKQQGLRYLEKYTIEDIRQIPQLRYMRRLKSLTLGLKKKILQQSIDRQNKAIEVFRDLLGRLVYLEHLDLGFNQLGVKLMKLLAPCIERLVNLRHLNLSENWFGSGMEFLKPYLE